MSGLHEATILRHSRPLSPGAYHVTGSPALLKPRVTVAGAFRVIVTSGTYRYTGATLTLAQTRYVQSGVYVLTGH